MSDSEDKTQAPTQRRRQQARESGQVAHSQDLGSAILLLGSLGMVLTTGGALVSFLVEFMQASLSGQAWQASLNAEAAGDAFVEQWQSVAYGLGKILLPVLGGTAAIAVAGHALQTGFLFLPSKLLPELSRVNPLTGFGRLWSGNNLARLAFGVFKLAVVATVGLVGLWSRRDALAGLAALDVPQMASQAWDACLWSCLEMGAALLALSAVDYLFQRARVERQMQMTPQELREEMRELQGDPQLMARRRDIARRRGQTQPVHSGDHRPTATTPAHIGAVDSI